MRHEFGLTAGFRFRLCCKPVWTCHVFSMLASPYWSWHSSNTWFKSFPRSEETLFSSRGTFSKDGQKRSAVMFYDGHFYSVSKVFACLQGMCHFVQYNKAERVHKYIFEMSHLIGGSVWAAGLTIWPGFCLFLYRFPSADDFLLRMDFVSCSFLCFVFFSLAVLEGKQVGGAVGVVVIVLQLWLYVEKARK